jgi:hypothetical protein
MSFPSSMTSDPSCTLSDASIEEVNTSPSLTTKINFKSCFYQGVLENLKHHHHHFSFTAPAVDNNSSNKQGSTVLIWQALLLVTIFIRIGKLVYLFLIYLL